MCLQCYFTVFSYKFDSSFDWNIWIVQMCLTIIRQQELSSFSTHATSSKDYNCVQQVANDMTLFIFTADESVTILWTWCGYG